MDLITALKIALADTFVFSFKAHFYHWNVTGNRFLGLHNYFGEVYEEVYDEIDEFAELIRQEGKLAPASIAEMYSRATIQEDEFTPGSCNEMIMNLIKDNEKILTTMNMLFEVATAAKAQNVVDEATERITVHKKYAWFLKSLLQGAE